MCVHFPRLYFVSFSSKFSGRKHFYLKIVFLRVASWHQHKIQDSNLLAGSCVCLCEGGGGGGGTNKGWVCNLTWDYYFLNIEDLKRILYIQFSLAFSQELCRVCTRNNMVIMEHYTQEGHTYGAYRGSYFDSHIALMVKQGTFLI